MYHPSESEGSDEVQRWKSFWWKLSGKPPEINTPVPDSDGNVPVIRKFNRADLPTEPRVQMIWKVPELRKLHGAPSPVYSERSDLDYLDEAGKPPVQLTVRQEALRRVPRGQVRNRRIVKQRNAKSTFLFQWSQRQLSSEDEKPPEEKPPRPKNISKNRVEKKKGKKACSTSCDESMEEQSNKNATTTSEVTHSTSA